MGSPIHMPTVFLMAMAATSLSVAFHEGVHAVGCIAMGGDLLSYSSLYVDCAGGSALGDRIVAGSASVGNILAGLVLCRVLRRLPRRRHLGWFVFALTLMNLLYGAGYWIFSGIGGVGDWAAVIDGWTPAWLWRAGMALVGSGLFVVFVRLAVGELGRILGGEPAEQIGRATRLCVVTYAGSASTVALAGLFSPFGIVSWPAIAGLLAVLGALSPLAWMTHWLRAPGIAKTRGEPLTIDASVPVMTVCGVVAAAYVLVLGGTFSPR